MFTYILIGVAILLLAATCYLAGYARSQQIELSHAREEVYDLIETNATLRAEKAAHEVSLTMLMNEVAS